MGILASLQAVLTLSGIAGIVLSLAMAVDANVLIFERTKEELRAGKSMKSAVADGYKNAFSAIFDSNLPLTTLPNFASFENRDNSQCAGLIVKRLNRLNDEKSSRIIIKTRLADDR